MKEPKDFHRLKISNAIIIVLTLWSLYISILKQIIHALRKQRIVSTSVSLPRTEDKKTQAGSEHNE